MRIITMKGKELKLMLHYLYLSEKGAPQVTPVLTGCFDNSNWRSKINSTSWTLLKNTANFCKTAKHFGLISVLYSGADGSTAAADRSVG